MLISIIFTFLLCFPFHFMYDLFSNFLTSVFFPVNESIWEHMKLISTSFYVYSLINYFLIKKKDKSVNNYLLNVFIIPIIGIIVYLIIFIPLYEIFGEHIIISIGLLLIIIILEIYLSKKLLNYKEIKYQDIIGVLGIIFTILIFTYLTYNPPKTDLFKESSSNSYGIGNKN